MVSILLPTYNGEKYISESIDSILNQTFPNFELLIGLNGNNESTLDILKSYEDERIRVLDYGQDKGKSKTLNKMVLETKYDIISLQDDDDIWIDTKLERQVPLIGDYDVVGSFIRYINELGVTTGSPNLFSEDQNIKKFSLLGENQLANTSVIFKKNIFFEVDGWMLDLDGIEDFDFWLRIMRLGKKFHNVPDYLVHHRLHDSSNFNTKSYDIKKIL